MEYRRDGQRIVARLDEGDEIAASLVKIAQEAGLGSAFFYGIGACRKAEISHYDTKLRRYSSVVKAGMLEIVSLSGNIMRAEGGPLVHAHIALGLEDFTMAGGHLVCAEVSPTCEIIIEPLSSARERIYDEKTGLRTMRF